MSEAQLLQKLCPQRESSPSFRRWEAENNMGYKWVEHRNKSGKTYGFP
jgi:hypothetical protein